MWILPRQLHTLAFVPGTEALISDLTEQSEICAQSLLVRSKPSPARTWSLKWKRDSWTQLLSGRILKPSLGQSFVGAWTSSLGAIHANHSAQQESVLEPKTPDISGPSFQMELLQCDQVSVSLKMSRDISRWGCPTLSKTWDAWVTERRGEFSARLKSAHLTRGSGSSSWPTPCAMEAEKAGKFDKGQMGQSLLALANRGELGLPDPANPSTDGSRQESWATPRAGKTTDENPETWAKRQAKGDVATMPLTAQVKVWRTPISSDGEGGVMEMREGCAGKYKLRDHVVAEQKAWATPLCSMAQAKQQDSGKHRLGEQAQHNTGGKLNPRRVETLMGLPVGWVMPSCQNPITPQGNVTPSHGTGSCNFGSWMTPEARNSTGYQVSNGKKILRLGSQVIQNSTSPVTIAPTSYVSSETESCQQPQNSHSELFGRN